MLSRNTLPKNDAKLLWTNHVIRKMVFYRLSQSRIKRILRNPKRSEVGIATGTIALMQPEPKTKKPSEVWLMYQRVGKKKRIITAWRYPGKSPVREAIPIPHDILEELESEGFSSVKNR
ncbi:MAG: hypothetical protein Q7S09_00595 [bacterium]|nr:hypothetical protein [bacterium]